MRSKRRGLAAILASIAIAVPLLAVAAPATADGTNPVRLNEVLQNNAAADQIELINTGAVPADVSGWIVKDDDDTRKLAIPAGTIIAPGAYLSVVTDDASNPDGFGLGKADKVRVYENDGVTLVDEFAWTAHQSTSYGRCPDGSGDFIVMPVATPGEPNVCETPAAGNIVINEIESDAGKGLADWVELTNKGTASVELGGLIIRDNDDLHTYAIPADTQLSPGAYFVVDDGQLGFGLGKDDSVRLFDGLTTIDEHSWGPHAVTTYGRCPDGTGPFTTTASATPGAANDCVAPETPRIAVNEVETNDGTPGDWIELANFGATDVDLSGFQVLDGDDTHAPAVIPAGTTIAAGGFYVVEEAALGFGLGKEDSARLYLPGGHTLVDSYTWTGVDGDNHAPTTFGRCPDGTGDWQVTTASTKGSANDCSAAIRVNEIESSGGTPGDWIELVNVGHQPADISGLIVRDNDDSDTHAYRIPAGTQLAAGAYFVIEEAELGYGLGGADSVRLLEANGTTVIDAYSWTEHAGVTYGRCPDGSGEFTNTKAATKGTANSCGGDLESTVWPGSASVTVADKANTFGADMSGLEFDGSVLWAVNNGNGTLHRLVSADNTWDNDAADGWDAGKTLRYPDGLGTVDAEGVTTTLAGAAEGVYVASERNTGTGGSGSRPSVLKYDVRGSTTELTAGAEWNLAADLPPLGANAGLEGIAWLPDSMLVAGGFVDQGTATAYEPADYPNHGDGLFAVGVEGSNLVYVYALDQAGTDFHRVAAFDSGFSGVMELEFDAATGQLYVICDDACDGRMSVFGLGDSEADAGVFVSHATLERPAGMPNLANEGFAIAPIAQCVDGSRPVVWADDSQTGGNALRSGTIDCVPTDVETPGGGDGTGDGGAGGGGTGDGNGGNDGAGAGGSAGGGAVAPAESSLTEAARGTVSAPPIATAGDAIVVKLGATHAGERVDAWLFSTPMHLGTATVSAAGTITVTIPAATPAGVHRLAVVDAAGTLIGWTSITVRATTALASTGVADPTGAMLGAMLMLVLGGVVVVGRRRAGMRAAAAE